MHALINAYPLFRADFKTFSTLDRIEVNIFKVNGSILPTFFTYSPFLFYKLLRLTLSNTGDCPSQINSLYLGQFYGSFMISQKPQIYFKKVLKCSAHPKCGRLCMHFILIIYCIYFFFIRLHSAL